LDNKVFDIIHARCNHEVHFYFVFVNFPPQFKNPLGHYEISVLVMISCWRSLLPSSGKMERTSFCKT